MKYNNVPLKISDYVVVIPTQINELSIDVILPEYNNEKKFISISNLAVKKKKIVMPKIKQEYVAEVIPDGQLSMRFIQKQNAAEYMQLYQFKKNVAKFLLKINYQNPSIILQQIHETSKKEIPIYLKEFPELTELIATYLEKVFMEVEINFSVMCTESDGIDRIFKSLVEINRTIVPMGCKDIIFMSTPNYRIILTTKNVDNWKNILQEIKDKITLTCQNNNVELIKFSASSAKMLDFN